MILINIHLYSSDLVSFMDKITKAGAAHVCMYVTK